METGETGETLFFIACFMRELGCGKKRDFLGNSKKCYFFIHFPILELVSSIRSSHNSAPKGRDNLAHGVRTCEKFRSHGLPRIRTDQNKQLICADPCSSVGLVQFLHGFSSRGLSEPPSPAGAGERRRGGERAFESQGCRPGLRSSAASRLSNGTAGAPRIHERTSVTGYWKKPPVGRPRGRTPDGVAWTSSVPCPDTGILFTRTYVTKYPVFTNTMAYRVHAARPVRAAIMWPSATALGERWFPA